MNFISDLRSSYPALAHDLVQHDSRGNRHVQRRHFPQHGNGNQEVALLRHQIVDALPLRAQHDSAIHVVVERVVTLRAALVQPDDPEIFFFQTPPACGRCWSLWRWEGARWRRRTPWSQSRSLRPRAAPGSPLRRPRKRRRCGESHPDCAGPQFHPARQPANTVPRLAATTSSRSLYCLPEVIATTPW